MMQHHSILKRRYSQSGDNKVDALITSGNIGVGASVTATVSSSGSITRINNHKCWFWIFR